MNKIETLIAEGKSTVEQELQSLIVKCNMLKRERDEARREVCRSRASCIKDKQPEEIAAALEWDCFKED